MFTVWYLIDPLLSLPAKQRIPHLIIPTEWAVVESKQQNILDHRKKHNNLKQRKILYFYCFFMGQLYESFFILLLSTALRWALDCLCWWAQTCFHQNQKSNDKKSIPTDDRQTFTEKNRLNTKGTRLRGIFKNNKFKFKCIKIWNLISIKVEDEDGAVLDCISNELVSSRWNVGEIEVEETSTFLILMSSHFGQRSRQISPRLLISTADAWWWFRQKKYTNSMLVKAEEERNVWLYIGDNARQFHFSTHLHNTHRRQHGECFNIHRSLHTSPEKKYQAHG